MSIASRVKWFLEVNRVSYEVIVHPFSRTSSETVEVTDIPGEKLAKAVILEDDRGYVMPVVPATGRLDLDKINRTMERDLHLTTEQDAASLFFDCNDGAIPALGAAYGIPTIIDDALLGLGDIYFEGGDHVDLIHMNGADFFALIPDANHADLCA